MEDHIDSEKSDMEVSTKKNVMIHRPGYSRQFEYLSILALSIEMERNPHTHPSKSLRETIVTYSSQCTDTASLMIRSYNNSSIGYVRNPRLMSTIPLPHAVKFSFSLELDTNLKTSGRRNMN